MAFDDVEPQTLVKECEWTDDDKGGHENLVGTAGRETLKRVEVEAEPDGVVDTQETDVAAEVDGENHFEVSYQCLPDVDSKDDLEDAFGGLQHIDERALQYLDVLLQTDVHGIGINVGLGRFGDGEDSERVLVVLSFRRLDGVDVGPAEACGKICIGDILYSIDGDQVSSLQQLHTKLTGRLGTPRKFVLLRFLRPLTVSEDARLLPQFFCGDNSAEKKRELADSCYLGTELILKNNPEVAVLVRQLATTNQLLQDQLVESKLKQEEQNIQLDQLHALYARTQTEGLPLFSLSKSIRPFSRRSNPSDPSAGKSISSKVQTEVVDAANAEYARLRQEFKLQLAIDKRELEQKYAEKAKQLQEATAKKVEMLEAGFQQALQHYIGNHHCCRHCGVDTAPICEESAGEPPMKNLKCAGCSSWTNPSVSLLESATCGDVVHCVEDDTRCVKLRQIINALTEYEDIKKQRKVASWQLSIKHSNSDVGLPATQDVEANGQ